MGISFDSDEAKQMNSKIFETIYYGAMWKSMELSKEREVDMKCVKTGMFTNPETGEREFMRPEELMELSNKLNYTEEEINRNEF